MSLRALLGGEPAALLFDLDGTLLDSAPDLAQAVDRMLGELGYTDAGEQRVREWIGEGSRVLVFRALTGAGETPDAARVEAAQQVFFRHYGACLTDRSQLYPGVLTALEFWQAQGLAMACVTNKPARFTAPLLAHFDLERFMPVAIGGDTLAQRKPDPAPLREACRQLGVATDAAIMVGDSRNDVLAARAAGMPVVCVSYGYNHGRPVADEGPDLLVDGLAQLLPPRE